MLEFENSIYSICHVLSTDSGTSMSQVLDIMEENWYGRAVCE